jgi:hypothetical protein
MRRVSIPPMIADWSLPASVVVNRHQPGQSQLDEISIQLCKLRCSIKDGLIFGDEAIGRAVSIDSDLEGWATYTPISCRFHEVFDLDHPEDVFLGYYHVYAETRVAILWNHYRTLRILANEVLLDAFCPDDAGTGSCPLSQRLASEQLIQKFTAEICASVPPVLGFPTSLSRAQVIVGTLFLWPLYTCAAQNYVSPMTRDWVIIQLEKMGATMGIRLATLLARALRAKGCLNTAWGVVDAGERQKTVIQEIEEYW